MRVPILTDRQFQVLSLMYEGATRAQIAQALNVSPETIKNHTKAILSHFGVKTMRDGFDQVQYYMNNFGDISQGAAVQYLAVFNGLEIHPDRDHKVAVRHVQGQVIRGSMTAFQHYLRTSQAPTEYTMNGCPPSAITVAGEHRAFEYAFDPPLDPGATFDVTIKHKIKMNDAPDAQYYSEMVKRPTKNLVIEIVFPNGRPDDITFSKVESPNVETIQTNTELTATTARLVVKTPKVGGVYTVAWRLP